MPRILSGSRTRRTSTEQRTSDADPCGAALDGDLEIVTHPHRQLRQAERRRSVRKRREPERDPQDRRPGPRPSVRAHRAPGARNAATAASSVLDGATTPLRLAGEVDLREHRRHPGRRRAISRPTSKPIDAVPQRDVRRDGADLVALDLSDEVQRNAGAASNDASLPFELLGVVLADGIGAARRRPRRMASDAEPFGDRDETRAAVATGARDALADVRDVGRRPRPERSTDGAVGHCAT